MKLGIIGAMNEEVNMIVKHLTDVSITQSGNRMFYEGKFDGCDVVVAFSRWGKVAASATATTMILRYQVDRVVFLGIAGAIVPQLKLGDIVIGQRLFQHDMDARPLMRRFEVPLTGQIAMTSDDRMISWAKNATTHLFDNQTNLIAELEQNGLNLPSIYIGDIASGDRFVAGEQTKGAINEALPSVLCVEMEGAAVAQVCFEHAVPFLVIRTISDTFSGVASEEFNQFCGSYASKFSYSILKALISKLDQF